MNRAADVAIAGVSLLVAAPVIALAALATWVIAVGVRGGSGTPRDTSS